MASNYSLGHGTKIEYCATENGSYTRLKGCTGIPEIGGAPDSVSTDSLDNTKYHTEINGLMAALKFDLSFNMEDPNAEANINLANAMEVAGTPYYFKITYTNGLVLSFRSEVRNSINATNPNEIIGFTMHLAAIDEPVITLPTASV